MRQAPRVIRAPAAGGYKIVGFLHLPADRATGTTSKRRLTSQESAFRKSTQLWEAASASFGRCDAYTSAPPVAVARPAAPPVRHKCVGAAILREQINALDNDAGRMATNGNIHRQPEWSAHDGSATWMNARRELSDGSFPAFEARRWHRGAPLVLVDAPLQRLEPTAVPGAAGPFSLMARSPRLRIAKPTRYVSTNI